MHTIVEFFGYGKNESRMLSNLLLEALNKKDSIFTHLVDKIAIVHNDDAKSHDLEKNEFSFIRVSSTDEKHVVTISDILQTLTLPHDPKKQINVFGQQLLFVVIPKKASAVSVSLQSES